MLLGLQSLFSEKGLSISEFTLDDLRTISFLIENDSDKELYNFLISKINNNCNSIDKFNLLLQSRCKFINEKITLNNGESNISINLKLLIDNYIKNITNIRNIVNIEDFYITLDYPEELIHNDKQSLEIDCIKHIIYKGKEVNIQNLKNSEKIELYEKLPIAVIREVKNFIDKSNQQVILMEPKFGLPEISVNFFNESFSILKTLYNYYNYEDIIDMVFILSKRIPDIQYLNTRNPRDLENIIRLYEDELANSSSPAKLTL